MMRKSLFCLSAFLFFLVSLSVASKEKIDINTASAEELDNVLINIGPKKAEAIVAYRKENGPFKSADDLTLVKGINRKTVEKNQELIDIGATTAPARKSGHTQVVKPLEKF